MNLQQSIQHIKNHGIYLHNSQVLLTKPLYVFKKVYSHGRVPAVASLVIPIGAMVNLPSTYHLKCRSDKALCYSISTLYQNGKVKASATSAVSGHKDSMGREARYISAKANNVSLKQVIDWANAELKAGTTQYNIDASEKSKGLRPYFVRPDSFTYSPIECAPGVHWFLESDLAVNY